MDEDLLIDSEDEFCSPLPTTKIVSKKKIKPKLSTVQKIRRKCVSILNKKVANNKMNTNKEKFTIKKKSEAVKKFRQKQKAKPVATGQNQINLKYEKENNENVEADLRMIFLETLAECANKSGIFGILSRTFSFNGTAMNDVTFGSLAIDKCGIVSNALTHFNSYSSNVSFNINSNFANESQALNKTYRNEQGILNTFLSELHSNNSKLIRDCFNGTFSADRNLNPNRNDNLYQFNRRAIMDSDSLNFSRVGRDSSSGFETPKRNLPVLKNCFSENIKRNYSRFSLMDDSSEERSVKRFKPEVLDLTNENVGFSVPAVRKPIDLNFQTGRYSGNCFKSSSRVGESIFQSSVEKILSSGENKEILLETPKNKKSLRLYSSENIQEKNKKSRLKKLLVESDDDEDEDESWSLKSSLKIFCTPKSNKKTENDVMENSDSDECEVIFESVRKS